MGRGAQKTNRHNDTRKTPTNSTSLSLAGKNGEC